MTNSMHQGIFIPPNTSKSLKKHKSAADHFVYVEKRKYGLALRWFCGSVLFLGSSLNRNYPLVILLVE